MPRNIRHVKSRSSDRQDVEGGSAGLLSLEGGAATVVVGVTVQQAKRALTAGDSVYNRKDQRSVR